MKNYSQNDEQAVILNYFKGFKGTFCDIGANDGVTFSNTYALRLLGWSGTLIEASPLAFKRLYQNYRKHIALYGVDIELYDIALTETSGSKVLQESGALVGKDDIALVSTFHKHEMNRFKEVVDYAPVQVKCLSWTDFIKRSLHKYFDYISMDIEGSELEVLPQMDLSEVNLFCIEWNGNKELKAEYEKYFGGFRLIHTTAENLIYAR